MAKSLRQRIVWHSEQKLTLSALRSGFLSTFRFTLLALNGYDYSAGAQEIDRFMDQLSICWKLATTAIEAKSAEAEEIAGRYLYPLNLQGNHRPELVGFHGHLTSMRAAYKARHLKLPERPDTSSSHPAPRTSVRVSRRMGAPFRPRTTSLIQKPSSN